MDSIKPQTVYKFYFLDYFYVLLKCICQFSSKTDIFNEFKVLKQKLFLGESKYRKLSNLDEELSRTQQIRFLYTLDQIIEESLSYGFIEKQNNNFFLTDIGNQLLALFNEKSPHEFYYDIFKHIEKKHNSFRWLVDFAYKQNPEKGGLIIFPMYSPLKLGFNRNLMKKTSDIYLYMTALGDKIRDDIYKNFNSGMGDLISVPQVNQMIEKNLRESGLIDQTPQYIFDPKKYNAIVKRIRDHWLNHLLTKVYRYPYSYSTFEIWIYRARQIGIFNVTDFYPGFNGRIVYPTSLLTDSVRSPNFKCLYQYSDQMCLFIHYPGNTESFEEDFTGALFNAYQDSRELNRLFFVNLSDIRERVCYQIKIAPYIFDRYLETVYNKNLSGGYHIKISLESDRLPQETNAMYLKREPVQINGILRNIIAVDFTGRKK